MGAAGRARVTVISLSECRGPQSHNCRVTALAAGSSSATVPAAKACRGMTVTPGPVTAAPDSVRCQSGRPPSHWQPELPVAREIQVLSQRNVNLSLLRRIDVCHGYKGRRGAPARPPPAPRRWRQARVGPPRRAAAWHLGDHMPVMPGPRRITDGHSHGHHDDRWPARRRSARPGPGRPGAA